MPEEMVQAFKPEYVAPLVALLCSDQMPEPRTGGLYEVGSGWIARTRWQRSGGHGFPVDRRLTPEAVAQVWDKIVDFDDGRADHPENAQDGLKSIMNNMGNRSQGGGASKAGAGASAAATQKKGRGTVDQTILDNIARAKQAKAEGSKFSYDDRDVILYSQFIPPLSHSSSVGCSFWSLSSSSSSTFIIASRVYSQKSAFLD